MGTCSFQIRNEAFFCKVKASGNPRRGRGTERSKASAKKWYVAQGIPLIDAEIAKKGHFWMETN
jgi:hypothetical protein